jgi:hypothetical protein
MGVSSKNGGYRVVLINEDASGPIRVKGPQEAKLGNYGSGIKHFIFNPPNKPGNYDVTVGGEWVGSFSENQYNRTATGLGYGWNGGVREIDWPSASAPEQDAGDAETVSEPSDANEGEIDPSDYAGIVNADNSQGIALAPRLRREGFGLSPEGATVTLPDGETVEVGAISDEDEVARYLEGDEADDVIDADQDATDSGDSTGSSSSMEPAAAAAGLLAIGYVLTR